MDREWSFVARIALIATLMLGLAGCYEQEPKPRITGEQHRVVLPPSTKLARQHLIGRSVQGRPILIQIAGQGDDTVLIMGSIHGDEVAGDKLVNRLAEYLQDSPQLLTEPACRAAAGRQPGRLGRTDAGERPGHRSEPQFRDRQPRGQRHQRAAAPDGAGIAGPAVAHQGIRAQAGSSASISR